MMKRWTMAVALLAVAAPARAEERDYCPARPGLGTPACTIAPGRISLETGLADWTRDDDGGERSDTILIGDTLVRIGLTDTIEAQIGWTPFGHVRMRDGKAAAAATDTVNRVGDAFLGVKTNLRNPDGSGFSAAVQPFVSLPIGRSPVGAGDWSAGLVVPISFDVSGALSLQFSPEVDAAVDQDGGGHHAAFGSVVGLGIAINDSLTITPEVQLMRDSDPAGATTQALGGLSLGWMASDTLQIDVGANGALNHASPDMEFYFGLSRRF